MIYVREALAGLISPWVVLSDARFARQLQQFAYTELYTHYDIAEMAARQPSPLREEMQRHANDELRHHGIFLDWARKTSAYITANYADSESGRALDRERVQALVDQDAAPHRKLPTLFEYMAYVFLSESRAVLQFKLYQWINVYDRRCRETIPRLLADETRHVGYSLRVAGQEFRRAPGASAKGLLRVLGFILRQDLVDLLKLVQIVGSGLMTGLLYYGVVTPYALLQRVFAGVRRGRLRRSAPSGPVRLDDEFWERP